MHCACSGPLGSGGWRADQAPSTLTESRRLIPGRPVAPLTRCDGPTQFTPTTTTTLGTMRRLTRRHLICCWLAVGVVGLVLVVAPAPPAAADDMIPFTPDGPGWYQDLFEVCEGAVDIPLDALGTFTNPTSGISLGLVGSVAPLVLPSSTAVVGGGAAAAVTGPQAALAALVGGGAFCGTLISLEVGQFGLGLATAAPLDIPTLTLPGNTSGLQQCSTYEVPVVQDTDRCVYVTLPLPFSWPSGSQRFILSTSSTRDQNSPYNTCQSYGGGSFGIVPKWRYGTYSYQFPACAYVDDGSESRIQYHYPKPAGYVSGQGQGYVIRLDCDDDPTCRLDPTTKLEMRDYNAPYATRAEWLLDIPVQERGHRREAYFTTRCKRPVDGVITETTNWSDPYWDIDETPEVTKPKCASGFAEIGWWTGTRRVGAPGETWPLKQLQRWDLPASIVGNPTSLSCFLIGITNCPMWSESTESPTVRLGGPQGLEYPKTSPTIGTITQPMDQVIQPIVQAPSTDPNVTTTTVAGTGTTVAPPSTTIPQDTSIPPADPPPPSAGPGDESDNQWSTCMEDQVDSDWSEVTFNPVTWVRAIIYYVTAPIICALWWLVVPPDGFGALVDLFREQFDSSPLIQALSAIDDQFTFSGGCAPVDFGDPMAGWGPPLGVIDVGMCGNLVIALVWTVLLGIAVVGMAGHIIQSLSLFGARKRNLMAA